MRNGDRNSSNNDQSRQNTLTRVYLWTIWIGMRAFDHLQDSFSVSVEWEVHHTIGWCHQERESLENHSWKMQPLRSTRMSWTRWYQVRLVSQSEDTNPLIPTSEDEHCSVLLFYSRHLFFWTIEKTIQLLFFFRAAFFRLAAKSFHLMFAIWFPIEGQLHVRAKIGASLRWKIA